MIKFIKRLFCKHDCSVFSRNIYGDEINYANARSVWKCSKCGDFTHKAELNTSREAALVDLIIQTAFMPKEMVLNYILQAGYTKEDIKALPHGK